MKLYVGGGVGMWLLVLFIDLFCYHRVDKSRTGLKVIKLNSCSTQLTMKFSLLMNMKLPTIVGIFIFISREPFMLSYVLQKRICSC